MTTPFERSAAIVAVGDELVCGAQVDLNSAVVAARLLEHGVSVEEVCLLPDDEERLAAQVAALAGRRALVVLTGGLGPTLDDVTRHAVARAAGRPLVVSPEACEQVARWFRELGRPMPATNDRQALVPEGATLLENTRGTAPGFHLPLGRARVFVLPGPPGEMRAMLERDLLPWVAAHPPEGATFLSARLCLAGLSESVFAERAGAWMARDAEPRMGVTACAGLLTVHLRAHGATPDAARRRLDERRAELAERFTEHLVPGVDGDLAFAAGGRLLAAGVTVATAESCTGGLVAERLTRVPGISAVFLEGFVTYANAAKTRRLGVPEEVIARHGAVSRETAEAMARGAAERAGARASLAITGLAGPGGGTAEKPVGLVWVAVSVDGAVRSLERRFAPAGRDAVREAAANAALALLLACLPAPAAGSGL